jgi:hypothetical protein
LPFLVLLFLKEFFLLLRRLKPILQKVYQKDLFPILRRLQLDLLNQVVMLNLLRLGQLAHSFQPFQQLLRRRPRQNYIVVDLIHMLQHHRHYYLDLMMLFDPLDL